MARNRLVLAFASLTLLAACQSAPTLPEGGRYAGLAVQLREPITVPAGSATVRVQNGKTVAMNAVQEFDPYCIFELDTVRDKPQPVQPGWFDVTKVEQRIQDFSGMPVMPTIGMLGPFYSGGGPSQIYYVTQFYLKSDTDPRIRSLRCESNQIGIPAPAQHFLTAAELKQAMGGYFSLGHR